jgi:putative nucleotidyltransferase with HDIG domain
MGLTFIIISAIQGAGAFLALFLYFKRARTIVLLLIGFVLFFLALARFFTPLNPFKGTLFSELITILITAFIFFIVYYSVKNFEDNKMTTTYLKALWNIDRIMLTGLTPKSIIGAIKQQLINVVDCNALAICTVDNTGENCRVLANYNLNPEINNQMISKENSFFWGIIQNRKAAVYSNPSGNNSKFEDLLRHSGFRTCIGIPLVLRGMTLGSLLLFGDQKKDYKKKDMQFIEGIARQLVIAMERIQSVEKIKEMNVESVFALIQAIEMRDPCTKGHSFQVAILAREIARQFELPEKKLEQIEFAGLLHDVGKIVVPESILQKPGPLNVDEWIIMKKHPLHSAEIIKPIKNLSEVVDWIKYHHERWDGSGYPEGLSGDQIPFEARILAICDAYSAMIGKRPYRDGFTEEQARKEIERFAGRQFDPEIVKIFLSIPPDLLRNILIRTLGDPS